MPDDPATDNPAKTPAPAAMPAPPPAPLKSLPRGGLPRQVFILALPMLSEQIGQFLVGFVDVGLAGRISKEATTAVGAGAYFGWFTMMAFALVSVGAGALVARAFGAGDRRMANRVTHQAILLALAIGVIVSTGAFLAAPLVADLMTKTSEAEQICRMYLRTDALGFSLAALMIVGMTVSRAAGNTITPMIVMIILQVVNIAVSTELAFGIVFGVELGAVGIAVGTVTARLLGGVLMLAVLMRGMRGLQVRRRLLIPHRPTIKRMLRIGGPSAADSSFMGAAQLTFVWIVTNTAAGDAATVSTAAHMIAMRMEAISYLPAVAYMTASATMVGQYLGAKRPREASRSAHLAALQACALTTLVAIAFFFGADLIYYLMSNDPAVWDVGVPAFRLLAFVQPILCAGIVYTGSLRGAGDTRSTMLFTFLSSVCVRLPVAYLCGVVLNGGLIGAWIGMWADNIFKACLSFTRFVTGGWQRVRV